MDSKLAISFGGFSTGLCLMSLIKDFKDAFNPTYLMEC